MRILIVLPLLLPPVLALATEKPLRVAASWTDGFCSLLDCPRPIQLVVDRPENMPKGAIARATRHPRGGCVLFFTPTGVATGKVVAHEVCHCTFDYAVMNEYGYEPWVEKTEQQQRERWAQECARRLTDGSWGKQ